MSFATSLAAFSAQAARARTEIFSGETDAEEYNLQIGTVRFRAPFTTLNTTHEAMMHGKHVRTVAKALLPARFAGTLTTATTVLHLPTGDVYELVEFRAGPGTDEIPVMLLRQEA